MRSGSTAASALTALDRADAWESLQRLDLVGAGVGDEGAREVAVALEKAPNLRDVLLEDNEITDEGAVILAAGLAKSKRLARLNLNLNKIGDRGSSALAAALAGHAGLETLHLNENPIGASGAASLATSLDGGSRLLKFTFFPCKARARKFNSGRP